MIGDWLYRLTPRDAQLAGIEPFCRAQTITASALSAVSTSFFIPQDSVAVLTHAFLRARPVGTVTCESCNLTVRIGGDSSGQLHILLDMFSSIAGQRVSESYGGSPILIGHGGSIFANAFWSAGNSGNIFEASVAGYLIPRGNVQTFRVLDFSVAA